MKTALILVSLFFLLVPLWSAQGDGQETSKIIVTGNALNNRVVILEITKAGKAYELQCNQGASACSQLKNSTYQMLELPKNFGMYDCRDVEVYTYTSSEKRTKIGEYCLTEK